MYAVTISFLALVTPANFVTDPYTIFWLKTHKINTSKAAALTTCNALLWEIAQLIITMPSFIWMIMNWQSIFGQGAIDRQSGLIVFIFMIIGMLFNFIGLAFMIIIGFNKKLHYLVSRIFNWVKKLLHMSYHVKTETYQTYVVEAKMQREFLIIFKMWKSTIFILTIVIIDEIYLYFTIVMCIKFLAEINGDYFKLNIWEIFNVANVTTTANRFVPLPGNEFSIEWIMKEFMCTKIGGIQPWPITSDDDTTVLINNSIMIWRTWTSYFPAMIGAFGFGFLTINQVKQYRKKTLVQN
jgi:hypothetical protein